MKTLGAILFFLLIGNSLTAQDSTRINRIPVDTSKLKLNMDAVYNRPFLQVGKTPVALGGYVEANTQYSVTNGVTDGLSFQMRRLTIFMASTITKRIKFLSEIEFEGGTKEINIEFAAIDFEFNPLFIVRGGVVMNPIGAFNQNHDGPKWEFVDRPISATQMLPATWSNVGFGVHGKYYKSQWVFAYEVYLTNGFDDRIIANEENKTFLPASKDNPDRFEESSNGVPLFTGKLGMRHRKIGELGLSYMGGVYNTFRKDGITLDERRNVNVMAIDFNTVLPTKTYINGEFAFVHVDVPDSYTQQIGSAQQGGFIDIVQPVLRKRVFGWDNAVLNIALRTEYVDWNKGTFVETGTTISDDVFSIMPGVSFRPSAQTVIRLNYRYQWQQDLLGNPPAKTAAIQFGISSYF
ncbi:MAG TPA: hypothetical protein VFE57_03460 [Cyclobacteriaceae bacterium]|nr:hypothetical protein [Cyclobacteriaceae bacterium]